MESGSTEPDADFAREILTRHPQISFEHASAAAGDYGLRSLPRGVFYATVRKMGIERADAMEGAEPANTESRRLLEQLDHLLDECRETDTIRKALQNIRTVVHAALAKDH